MDFNNEKKELIDRIRSFEVTYTVLSRATKLPYVECDRDSYDDQAHLFATEDQVQTFIREHEQRSIPLLPVNVRQQDMMQFFTSLYMTGVNRIIFHDKETSGPVYLDEIAILKTPSVPSKDIPVRNTSLQLSCIYFMQELRRPGQEPDDLTEAEQQTRMRLLRNLEKEVIVNLVRSKFIIPAYAAPETDAEKKDEDADVVKGTVPLSRVSLPYLKSPAEEIMQPVFSDLWEFQKFAERHPHDLRIIPIKDLSGLRDIMMKDAKAFVLNPSGFNLILTRDKLNDIVTVHFDS